MYLSQLSPISTKSEKTFLTPPVRRSPHSSVECLRRLPSEGCGMLTVTRIAVAVIAISALLAPIDPALANCAAQCASFSRGPSPQQRYCICGPNSSSLDLNRLPSPSMQRDKRDAIGAINPSYNIGRSPLDRGPLYGIVGPSHWLAPKQPVRR